MTACLTITRGLPASGKTTWAKAQQAADPSIVLVCRDDLRRMLHDGEYSRENEVMVVKVEIAVAKMALKSGRSVIVHDTNMQEPATARWVTFAAQNKVELVVQDFTDIDVETCVQRNAVRLVDEQIPEEAIRRMAQG